MARAACTLSATPGACRPEPYPSQAEHHGSFSVIHEPTRSPRAACTATAYSAKRSAVSRAGQPPASCSGSGRSQW